MEKLFPTASINQRNHRQVSIRQVNNFQVSNSQESSSQNVSVFDFIYCKDVYI